MQMTPSSLSRNKNKTDITHTHYDTRSFLQEMLLELQEKKRYSCSQIAYRSKLPKTTIHKLKEGISQNLSYRNFCKLLGLYCAVLYDEHGIKKE